MRAYWMLKMAGFLLLSFVLEAQVQLPSFFSDHMVLQQNENVNLWGRDRPGQTIVIESEWGQSAETVVDDEGKWETSLPTPSAGGPYKLIINGSDEVVLRDVMIGEVWICSGQSNMVMTFSGYMNQPVFGAGDAILYGNQSDVRMFTAEAGASLYPLSDLKGKWMVSSTESVPHFSAVACYFGKILEEVLDVPVGLIVSAYGGSRIEAWMDDASLQKLGVNEVPEELPEKNPQHSPTLLYNAMIHPLKPFTTRGFLWYQGENNVADMDDAYEDLFVGLIDQWRNDFEKPDLPFYFVEIAPYNYKGDNSAVFREMQYNVMKKVENTGMVSTIDLGDCSNVHPGDKYNVGRRLALWALAQTYGMKGFQYTGPAYSRMEETKFDELILFFDHAERGLYTFDDPVVKGFEIAAEEGDFYPADVKLLDQGKILIWSDQVKNPEMVRYGFSNCPETNLFNLERLPVPSFRAKK